MPFTKTAMESVLLAAMFVAASTSHPVNEPVSPVALDERCFRLMASLAEADAPQGRSLGQVAAQYVLGRIDAAHPGADPDALLAGDLPEGAARESLIGACGDAMQAGGVDLRALGRALPPPRRPTI